MLRREGCALSFYCAPDAAAHSSPAAKPAPDVYKRQMLALAAAETGAIVTAEDHNIVGGLGSAVCEALAQRLPVPVLRVGVEDKFGMSGHGPELYEAYGLTAEHIAAACADAIAFKRRG